MSGLAYCRVLNNSSTWHVSDLLRGGGPGDGAGLPGGGALDHGQRGARTAERAQGAGRAHTELGADDDLGMRDPQSIRALEPAVAGILRESTMRLDNKHIFQEDL